MFKLSQKQNLAVALFIEQNATITGSILGQFSFTFTPDSLGMRIVVKDNNSGKTLDISEYD